MSAYLKESGLPDFLGALYPGYSFLFNKQIPGSGQKFRPDAYSASARLVVEFDGWQHYNSASRIKKDWQKYETCGALGLIVVRIPYFIQTCNGLVDRFPGAAEVKVDQDYPHGFVDPKALLPADFCELGVKRFVDDLFNYDFATADIIDSLRRKVTELSDVDLVLPRSLQHLLEA
jgi:hypothetical protein